MRLILPFRMTVCGLGELTGFRQGRVSHVLSILDPGVPEPPDFDTFDPHQRRELRFHDVTEETPGMRCPQPDDIRELLEFVRQMLTKPQSDAHLLVHCHAGYSRSPAAAVLIAAQARPDLSARQITAGLLRIRPNVWPNLRMLEIGDSLLRRQGEIIGAGRDLYREQLEQEPELAQRLREGGRGREVELAMRDQ